MIWVSNGEKVATSRNPTFVSYFFDFCQLSANLQKYFLTFLNFWAAYKSYFSTFVNLQPTYVSYFSEPAGLL